MRAIHYFYVTIIDIEEKGFERGMKEGKEEGKKEVAYATVWYPANEDESPTRSQ